MHIDGACVEVHVIGVAGGYQLPRCRSRAHALVAPVRGRMRTFADVRS